MAPVSPPRIGAPLSPGIGLRFPHHEAVMASPPPVGWFEVHSENYMCGGTPRRCLETIRRDRPVSLHGVGMSLGSKRLDERHLERLVELASAIEPMLVSEHLAWCRWDGCYLNDLLPVPYTSEAFTIVAANVDRLQDRLKRQVLIENPARYAKFADATIEEATFLAALSRKTGCGILLDLNNLYVNACNLGGDASRYLSALPSGAVKEIHLAGHTVVEVDGVPVRIDDHGSKVAGPVWALYFEAVALFPNVETLIEWDCRLPAIDVLFEQAALAARCRALAEQGIHRVAA